MTSRGSTRPAAIRSARPAPGADRCPLSSGTSTRPDWTTWTPAHADPAQLTSRREHRRGLRRGPHARLRAPHPATFAAAQRRAGAERWNGEWDFRWAAAGEPWGSGGSWPCRALGAPRRRAYGRPQYTNVQFPFPVDPPHVPTRTRPETTGGPSTARLAGGPRAAALRRRRVGVPGDRLNGVEVGVGKGSRLVQEFDVTDLLRPGDQRRSRCGCTSGRR